MNKLTKDKLELKNMVERNKDFHYMITDRSRQDVDYYIRIKSKDFAKKAIDKVEFLLYLFEPKDLPEWYNFNDLENDKLKFKKIFSLS